MVDFIFDGKTLSSYGYMVCSFDSISIEKVPSSNTTFNTIKAPLSHSTKKISTDDGENLQKIIQICKNMCSNDNEELTMDDVSELTKWLCRSDYKWLRFLEEPNDNSAIDEIYYEAQIVASKIMLGDRCIGMELTINTNRPYGLTQENTVYWNVKAGNEYSVNVYSDEEGYIYPDVKIYTVYDDDLMITNTFESRITRINNCIYNEKITMNGEILQIQSSNSEHNLYDDFNFNFIRLCNKFENSVNTFTFSKDCIIEMKYRGIRKVGM